MIKWGCQTPNGDFDPADVVDVFNDGVYIIMQGEFNKLPELRNRAPRAFIMARFYLPNWYITDASRWASEINQILFQVNESDLQRRRNVDLIDAYTWANEQNLKSESGDVVGAPGIKPGDYEKILYWNMTYLGAAAILHTGIKKVFPALAMGNSDDQDDGAGIGLQILQPVIERCDYGAIHPYWNPDLPISDEWRGLGRIHKQLPFFKGKPVIVTETGNFAVDRANAAQQYLDAGYYMQGIQQIYPGFCFFIFSDPTKHHQQNDMSRNPVIYDAIKRAIRTERPTEWVASVVPVDVPLAPTDVLQKSAGKPLVAYQVWQWGLSDLPGNYPALKLDMERCGALILTDKYSDSTALQGEFDRSDMAIKSIQVMQERKAWCDDNGYIYMPWDVPRAIPVNNDPFEGARQEALFHARVCNEVGLKYRVSDLEFYKSFFGYALESRGGASFFDSMQERNDAAELYYRTFAENSDTLTILQPDLRQWDTIQFHRLVPYLHGIVGQSYAYWFQTMGDQRNHSEIIQDFINKAKALELSTFGLCLYSEKGTSRDTPTNLARELCQQAVDAKADFLFVYKSPIDDALQPILKEFASTVIDSQNPSPVDEIETVKNDAWGLGESAERIARQYEVLAERAKALGYGWMGNGFDAATKALDAASLAAKTAIKVPKE